MVQKKRVLFLIVCMAVLVVGSLPTSRTTRAENPKVSFKTPEDAITFYMQAVAQNDIKAILQVSAIDELTDNLNFDAYMDKFNGFYATLAAPAPAQYPFYREINRAQATWLLLSNVKLFTLGLLSTEAIDVEKSISDLTGERLAKFIKGMDPKRLSGITVIKIDTPRKKEMATYRQGPGTMAFVYGADEATERVALFGFEGNTYALGFTLYRYGETWKINKAVSYMSGINIYGMAAKMSAGEFDRMVNRD